MIFTISVTPSPIYQKVICDVSTAGWLEELYCQYNCINERTADHVRNVEVSDDDVKATVEVTLDGYRRIYIKLLKVVEIAEPVKNVLQYVLNTSTVSQVRWSRNDLKISFQNVSEELLVLTLSASDGAKVVCV